MKTWRRILKKMAPMGRTQERRGRMSLWLISRQTTGRFWLGCPRTPVRLPRDLHSTLRIRMSRI